MTVYFVVSVSHEGDLEYHGYFRSRIKADQVKAEVRKDPDIARVTVFQETVYETD